MHAIFRRIAASKYHSKTYERTYLLFSLSSRITNMTFSFFSYSISRYVGSPLVRADVPGREDLPQHALLSVVGQELSEVRPHAHVVPWPHAVAGVGGAILVDLGMEKHNCTRMKRWLRPRLLPLLLLICMVNQEPALFATTILDYTTWKAR